MRILGIDPGSVTTGFGVIDYERNRFSLVEQGVISTKRGATLPERLVQIHEGLAAVIGRTGPQVVAVETPFAGRNVSSLIQLVHARGVILLAAQLAKLEVHEYAPRSVKSSVTGFGGAEKDQVAKLVRMLLPGCAAIEMAPDASDALAVAICHAHNAGAPARLKIRT